MATAQPPAYTSTQQPTQQPFPENLPPRKFHQTWMQRNRFSAKAFFTLHYRSFSVRRRRDAKDVWRRISMWIIMISRLGLLVLICLMILADIYLNAGIGIAVALFILIAVLTLFVNAWNLALIADASGTRKAVGFVVRRKGLDWFLHVMAFLHIAVDATIILYLDPFLMLAPWGLLGFILILVGFMASAEPIDEYGMGA